MKQKFELYPIRSEMFQEIMRHVSTLLQTGRITENEIFDFRRATTRCKFFFGKNIVRDVERIYAISTEILRCNEVIFADQNFESKEVRGMMAHKRGEFTQELDTLLLKLPEKFAPYLSFTDIK